MQQTVLDATRLTGTTHGAAARHSKACSLRKPSVLRRLSQVRVVPANLLGVAACSRLLRSTATDQGTTCVGTRSFLALHPLHYLFSSSVSESLFVWQILRPNLGVLFCRPSLTNRTRRYLHSPTGRSPCCSAREQPAHPCCCGMFYY